MTTKCIFRYLVAAGIFCGLFTLGCEKQAQTGPAAAQSSDLVKIALRPSLGEQTSYKMTTKARRATKWDGPVPDKSAFNENFNEEFVELTFTQQIQAVDANTGVAVAKIKIDGLKLVNSTKDATSVNFDSSRKADVNNPIMKLIGQTYLIEFNPSNKITAVDDLPPVITSFVSSGTPDGQVGFNLMLPENITERHGVFQLPPKGEEMLKPGGTWSQIRTFPFGKMGLKSYEKIYKLEKVQDSGGRRIAVINMTTIPTSEVEPKYLSQQAETGSSKMFDSNDVYTGGGEIDLKFGRIENYHEDFRANWVVALPAKQNDTGEPVVLNMTATRVYSLERMK
jgi:hypothetical protein